MEVLSLPHKRKGQSKRETVIEVLANVGIGYVWAILNQLIVFPLVGIDVIIRTNLIIGLFFTVSSIIRGYSVRRGFNWYHVRKMKRLEK